MQVRSVKVQVGGAGGVVVEYRYADLELARRYVCCSVLQCVAVCCSVLQCVAVEEESLNIVMQTLSLLEGMCVAVDECVIMCVMTCL